MACNGQLFSVCSRGFSYVSFILFKQIHLGILYHKNKPFKLYIFMIFSKFIELCDHHQDPVLNCFHQAIPMANTDMKRCPASSVYAANANQNHPEIALGWLFLLLLFSR